MEAFGASKEVKFGGLEEIYINKFSNSAQILARTQASASIIGQLPSFFRSYLFRWYIDCNTLYYF